MKVVRLITPFALCLSVYATEYSWPAASGSAKWSEAAWTPGVPVSTAGTALVFPGDTVISAENDLGTLRGMCAELRGLYLKMEKSLASPTRAIVGSGNGMRLNRSLRRIVEETFALPLLVPQHREEEAFGAALAAAVATGVFPSVAVAQSAMIAYE